MEHIETTYEGMTVHRLSFDLARSPTPFLWSYRNPLIGQCARNLLDEFKPDVLHLISGYLMSGSTIEAAQAAKVPGVLTLTDFWFLCPRITLVRSDSSLCNTPADPLACTLCLRKEKRRYRIADRVSGGAIGKVLSRVWQQRNDALFAALCERKSYLLSLLDTVDVVISPSRFLKGLFEAQGVSPRRFLYMRQGLDVQSWADAEPGSRDSCLRFGYIGQVSPHKGVDVLVQAFCRLRPAGKAPCLTIYGDTNQFPGFVRRLRKATADWPNIVFAGRFEHSQIRRVHADTDVLVVPSVWYENSPNVILEAFVNGTPVVASRLGGMAELVTDGVNGFLFEVGNAKDLTHVLQRFVDQPGLVETLRRGAPPVKTVDEEIEELLRVYNTVREAGQIG